MPRLDGLFALRRALLLGEGLDLRLLILLGYHRLLRHLFG